jgi:hypothetical protein
MGLGHDLRILLRGPGAAPARSGKHLPPANQLGLDLCKSSVSDMCPTRTTQGRTIADQHSPVKEKA